MATSSPASCVFVYGTLMADEVVRTLLGHMPMQCPAVIKGYRRYAIKGRQYPAIIPVTGEGQQVRGKVLWGLNALEMRILDLFEDVEYTREVVTALPCSRADADAHADANGEGEQGEKATVSLRLPVEASAYVWRDRSNMQGELHGEWDYHAWRQAKLQDYVDMCRGFPDEGEGMDLRLLLEQQQQQQQQQKEQQRQEQQQREKEAEGGVAAS